MFFFGKNKDKEDQTLILYGSKSGNSKVVARLAQKYYHKNGKKALCDSIKSYSPEKLNHVQHLLLVISTHGEGDPPPAAKEFFKKLFTQNASSMAHLQYSVCALGDSSYQLFCEAGRKIDTRLQELGAKNFYPLAECDADYSKTAVEWIKGSWHSIHGNGKEDNPDSGIELSIDKISSYPARLINKRLLSVSDAENACYHLTFKAEGFSFLPGDSIEVKPQNLVWLMDKIAHLYLTPNAGDQEKKQAMESLKDHEITNVTEKTLRSYQEKAENNDLTDLLQEPQRIADYISCANVLDVLQDFPSLKVSLPALAKVLPPLRYRQYSLASCAGSDGSFDLMIKPVSYQFRNILHEGAASHYLCKTMAAGDTFMFRPLPNPAFRLPADKNLPLIMIANGSGIAPFRAFLQQCAASEIKPPTWLIFGERHQQTNFYYKEDITYYKNIGVLQKLNLAFSRDAEEKLYVQHVLQQQQQALLQWLKKGAHIYVCGSVKMGEQVYQTINALLQKQDVLPITGIDDLISADRYYEEVY